MQGPHSFPSYVSLCVCDNEKRTSLEVPLFRLVTSTAVLCTRETYGYISNCTENTFQLLYRFPFTSLFVSAVAYSTLFTNDLCILLILPFTPLSFRDLWYIHPSFLASCICFFCVSMASCYEALNVNDPVWSRPFYSILPRTASFSQPWLNRVCPVVAVFFFSTAQT